MKTKSDSVDKTESSKSTKRYAKMGVMLTAIMKYRTKKKVDSVGLILRV